MEWLAGADRIAGNDAGPYAEGGHFKMVLHRTEGSSIEGAVGAYRKNNSWAHLTIDIGARRIAQHLSFRRAARSLKNLPGGVQTNTAKVIQVELVGFSKDSPNISRADLEWLGDALAPVAHAFNIAADAPGFVGVEGYGTQAKQRFSFKQWNEFDGVLGHQHVPENSHWDPGKIDIAVVLARFADPQQPDLPPTPPVAIGLDDDGRTIMQTSVVIKLDEKGAGWCRFDGQMYGQPRIPYFNTRNIDQLGPFPPADGDDWQLCDFGKQMRDGLLVIAVKNGRPLKTATIIVDYV